MNDQAPVTAIIIDDDEVMRMTLRRCLEKCGAEVIGEADNGRTGVDTAIELEPNLILLDIIMPELNGYLAAEELTTRLHSPFIVMTTVVEDDEVKNAVRLAGIQDYILKSEPIEEQEARLRNHIEFLGKARQQPEPTRSNPAANNEPKKVRALIVDDDELMRMTIRAVLETCDVEIVGEAENGRIGVDMAIELEPDLIMLDIIMPELNGYLALEELSVRMHEPFIVMMTAVEDEEVKNAVRLAGVQDYIVKSAPMNENMERLQKHISFLRSQK